METFEVIVSSGFAIFLVPVLVVIVERASLHFLGGEVEVAPATQKEPAARAPVPRSAPAPGEGG